MPHAEALILEGRDAVHDPATELFLQEHLGECVDCRELSRKVGAADRMIVVPDPAAAVPQWRARSAGEPAQRVAAGAIAVAVIVVGVVAGTTLRMLRESPPSQVSAPGGPAASTLPKDWQLVIEQDLLIPLPPGWRKTVDTVARSDRPEPDPPRILYFEDPSLDRSVGARFLAIWIWPSRSVDQLVRERFVEGNLSHVSQGTITSWRPTLESVGVAQWSDARGAGSYLGRSLFVQADPERVVMVTVVGPQVPSKQTGPTAEMRQIQELVIHHVVALPDVAPDLTAEMARTAIERKLRLESAPTVGEGPPFFVKPVTWKVRDGADSTVRIYAYPAGTRPRATIDPGLLRGDSPPGAPRILRVMGNLVVWVSAPDANVRYTVLTALDAVVRTPGSRDGTCTTGPLSESARNGEFVFRSTTVKEGNEYVVVSKRGAKIGERLFATLEQLDGPGRIGLPTSAAEPLGSGELVFKVGIYKPAGSGCWRVDLRDPSDSQIVASYVVLVREP